MENTHKTVSEKTNQRWWLFILLSVAGIGVFASSIYFLIFPTGYQGGRNPFYGITFLFSREGWDLIHLWTGLAMILVVFIHIAVHWRWVITMAYRCVKPQTCEVGTKSKRAQYNLVLDLIAAVSFLLVTASGIYLMFAPSRSSASLTPIIIFDWYTWDVIHTWSGITMFISVLLHLEVHWVWIVNVTRKILGLRLREQKLKLDGVKNA
jgi:hypothetical protein